MKGSLTSYGVISILIFLVLFLLIQIFGFFSEIKTYFDGIEFP
jgi:hypothetical protein